MFTKYPCDVPFLLLYLMFISMALCIAIKISPVVECQDINGEKNDPVVAGALITIWWFVVTLADKTVPWPPTGPSWPPAGN